MRRLNRLTFAFASTFFLGCGIAADEGPTPYDDEHELANADDLLGGVPANDSLPLEGKADAVYPATFDIKATQSPVKSQGSRGVCSIFATTAQVEDLYIKAGAAIPDFSEQYLQWATKRLAGQFTWTDGSTGNVNLATVVDYGIVEESVWPYESMPWTEANDPTCKGENRPTKCYTNGEPPAAATTATKFKVPSSRYLNTNSIKAHITEKGTGVVVGLDFFYQSWNHRKSTLPVSTEYWQKGYVTYPNADDKTESYKQRAGHAIHIIGWNDNLEVPMRDKTGAQLLDANDQPRMEKGFWLFKNSWGTAGFGLGNEFGAGYGWLSYRYVREYGSAVAGETPDLGQRAEICDDALGADEDDDNDANCDDSDCAEFPACQTTGNTFNYSAAPNLSIPDNNSTGVSSVIDVTDAGTIAALQVHVKLTHTYVGDLKLTLRHGNKTITLQAFEGGSADNLDKTFAVTDFNGKANAGRYTLKVIDGASQDIGVLQSWDVAVTVNP